MERYCYFSSTFVSGDELRGAYQFTHDIALKKNLPITICVNNINANQSVEKIFDKVNKNKLERYQTISDGPIEVRLKTPRGLDPWGTYGVILAIHSSREAIKKIEAIKKLNTVVAIAEIHSDGTCAHLEKWAEENNANRLTPEKK